MLLSDRWFVLDNSHKKAIFIAEKRKKHVIRDAEIWETISLMGKDERLNELLDKVKKGIVLASRKFLKEAKARNQKIVIMRGGKVVLVHARNVR